MGNSVVGSMSTLNIQIGKDIIEGKLVGSMIWEFWLGSKKFSIDSSNETQDAVEILTKTKGPITLTGKQLHSNLWTTEYSVYESTAWGSISIWYTLEFNTESMKAVVKSEQEVEA